MTTLTRTAKSKHTGPTNVDIGTWHIVADDTLRHVHKQAWGAWLLDTREGATGQFGMRVICRHMQTSARQNT